MTKEAARWVIGPRSFRRLLPAFGWLGPLAMGRPAHAFAAQVRAILNTDESMADELANITCPALVMVGNQDILTPRGDSEEPIGEMLARMLREIKLPAVDDGRIWVGCEASIMRDVRRWLIFDQGWDRASIHTHGYWKLGAANHPDHDIGQEI